mmetsp:Transcript_129479/g.335858  ORF Transcript_129479/g.335858 Transcript_129479/m.335858 type:complete len:411 (-) Transcript_129479:74-1306(-)
MSRYKQIDDCDIPDDFVLPQGSVLRGQALFKKHCSQCHTIRKDGLNPYGTLWGPNLHGVMGRTAAQNQRSGGSRYSQSLEESGILWTDRNMMAFLKNPRSFAGGAINMNFRGIDSFRDRVDLVHYLKRAGHESWMVQDGTPHTQKKWWLREGAPGKTVQYWQANVDEKQIKPWQRLTRMVSEKAGDTWDEIRSRVGWEVPPAKGEVEPEDSLAATLQADPEVQKWRRVQQVPDGVKPASVQQSFNWPLPEEIAAGPVKKPPPRRSKARDRATEAAAAAAAAPATVGGGAGEAVWCSPPLAACEPPPPPPPLPGGERAPSGLMVYRDRTSVQPAAPQATPPAGRPAAVAQQQGEGNSGAAAVTSSSLRPAGAPQKPPSTQPPPASTAPTALGALRPDGGRMTPGGLIAYTN